MIHHHIYIVNIYTISIQGDLNVLQAIWKDSTSSILLLANMKAEAECIGSYSTILTHLGRLNIH